MRGRPARCPYLCVWRALSLVVSVRRVTPRGVPVRGVLVGGGVSVGAHGEGDVTLSSAEVIPEL